MRAIDCCKQEWTTKWNELRELYLKTVRTIKMNGKEYTTDGSGGVVDLGNINTEASGISITDGRDVQTAIDAIEDEIGSETASGSILAKIKANSDAIASETANRQNEDTQLADDIADESLARQNADNTLQTAIDEINGSISKNVSDIASNKTEIDANANAITTKQDKLTAGTGISISDTNMISNTGVTSINGKTGDVTTGGFADIVEVTDPDVLITLLPNLKAGTLIRLWVVAKDEDEENFWSVSGTGFIQRNYSDNAIIISASGYIFNGATRYDLSDNVYFSTANNANTVIFSYQSADSINSKQYDFSRISSLIFGYCAPN